MLQAYDGPCGGLSATAPAGDFPRRWWSRAPFRTSEFDALEDVFPRKEQHRIDHADQ